MRKRLLWATVVLVAVWFVFLDSHGLLKRVQYVNERAELLEANLRKGLTDELIEKVAREDYGMRRDGETVYPVESARD